MDQAIRVWYHSGPRRIGEAQRIMVRGRECQGGVVRAMEGWRMPAKNGEGQQKVVRDGECQGGWRRTGRVGEGQGGLDSTKEDWRGPGNGAKGWRMPRKNV